MTNNELLCLIKGYLLACEGKGLTAEQVKQLLDSLNQETITSSLSFPYQPSSEPWPLLYGPVTCNCVK